MQKKVLCDEYYEKHKRYHCLDLDFDIFGRTSEQKHIVITQELFLELQKKYLCHLLSW